MLHVSCASSNSLVGNWRQPLIEPGNVPCLEQRSRICFANFPANLDPRNKTKQLVQRRLNTVRRGPRARASNPAPGHGNRPTSSFRHLESFARARHDPSRLAGDISNAVLIPGGSTGLKDTARKTAYPRRLSLPIDILHLSDGLFSGPNNFRAAAVPV